MSFTLDFGYGHRTISTIIMKTDLFLSSLWRYHIHKTQQSLFGNFSPRIDVGQTIEIAALYDKKHPALKAVLLQWRMKYYFDGQ